MAGQLNSVLILQLPFVPRSRRSDGRDGLDGNLHSTSLSQHAITLLRDINNVVHMNRIAGGRHGSKQASEAARSSRRAAQQPGGFHNSGIRVGAGVITHEVNTAIAW